MFAVYPTTMDLGGAMQTRWPTRSLKQRDGRREREREREVVSIVVNVAASSNRVNNGLRLRQEAAMATLRSGCVAVVDGGWCSGGSSTSLYHPSTNQRRIKYHSIYPSNICAFTVERVSETPLLASPLSYLLYPLVPLCIQWTPSAEFP